MLRLLMGAYNAKEKCRSLVSVSFRRVAASLIVSISAILWLPVTAAQLTGPTLYLAHTNHVPSTNSVSDFMYFVPLISPGPVTSIRNAGNTQRAQIVSVNCRTNGRTFHASCEFDFIGQGYQQHLFDHSQDIREHEQALKKGASLEKQLIAILVQGGGSGVVETEGVITNGVCEPNQVRLRFNHHHPSPVFAEIADFCYEGKECRQRNQLIARVNTLTFRRTPGPARMEISLASVNKKGAKDNLWQSVIGGLKGATVNLFIPPVPVDAFGVKTMLDFGGVLAGNAPTFTFPLASRLKADLVQ